MDASEEAEVDEAPGDECSARIVVPCAMHELEGISGQLLCHHEVSILCYRGTATYYRRVLEGLDDDAILLFICLSVFIVG